MVIYGDCLVLFCAISAQFACKAYAKTLLWLETGAINLNESRTLLKVIEQKLLTAL